MRFALIASLVVNVFLAFAILSGTVLHGGRPPMDGPRHHGDHDNRGGGDDLFLSPRAFEDLPEEFRLKMREKIRRQIPAARDLHREVWMKRREALELMRKPDFDEDAFRQLSQEMRTLEAEGKDLMYSTVLDMVTSLPDEERIAFAERVIEQEEEMRARWRGRIEEWREEREGSRDMRPLRPMDDE
ncbi:periplasmic heavy metal sensor [Aquisalinus flavus]|uniref:Periplasmic heavy metal sensor n=1 Tax=Aquisalinus flavus TaxID=1526572 RepID=A0A8J2Y564_9PROT|nr:periplasmic heavy metal sensor [Aquisalinus flavus]MBD0426306.1 periplasmic heavy metal sensor [Aquisalinus flavus]UNE48126.1 periplasmic heavy metal sensor [Aquisalinus flavus]GGD08983.1 hypothetical protein GCM10011342_17300 [Aquisalinus flavus]